MRWIPEDSWVVDVGANIGFFTERFAKWSKVAAVSLRLNPIP